MMLTFRRLFTVSSTLCWIDTKILHIFSTFGYFLCLFFFYLLFLIRLSFGRQAKVGDDQPFFPHEFYDVLEELLYFLCVSWVIRLWVFNLCYLLCVSMCYTFASFCKCILSVQFVVIMTRDCPPPPFVCCYH